MNRRDLARHVFTPLAVSGLLVVLILTIIAFMIGFQFELYVGAATAFLIAAISGAFAFTWWEQPAPFNLEVIEDRSPVRLSDDTE